MSARPSRAALAAGLVLALALPAAAHPPARRITYPASPVKPVHDAYHGEVVVDPYRWLEDGEAPAVKAWTDDQNALSRRWLDALPERPAFRARVQALMSPERREPPVRRGGRWFFKRQDGKTPQAVLMAQDVGSAYARTLVDPNRLGRDGSVSLDWWEASPNGRYVAYGLSANGDEQSVLHVVDVATGKPLREEIAGCRHASVAWMPDERGFYYTCFPGTGANGTVEQKVFFHELGTDDQADAVVFDPPGGPEMVAWAQVSDDARHLLVGVNQGSSENNALYHQDLKAPGSSLKPLVTGFKHSYWGDIHRGTLYMLTNDGAPRGRIVAVDLARPARAHWRTIVAERRDALKGVAVAGGKLVVEYLHDATSQVRIFGLDGRPKGMVPLPGIGTVQGMIGRAGDRDLFLGFTSYLQPTSVYRYDVATGRMRPHFTPKLPIRPAGMVQRQVWYRSKDGTRVPMFLVHRRGLRLDGTNPTILYGYGGFDISLTPWFSAKDYAWVERGGVMAIANLRGGGEFGRAWHEGGMRHRKQNVFDDFTAAGDWLVRNGVTSRRHLGVEGGSNGGLLVGAALTQHPERYRAVVCGVPLLDMLRYHKFSIAKYWIPEYGSSDDRAQYRYLKAYSPYHHVTPGRRYPATLIQTGESDTRVDPLHARKMAARLQRAQGGQAPILLHVERAAGHGAGKPLTKRVEDAADGLAFMAWQLR